MDVRYDRVTLYLSDEKKTVDILCPLADSVKAVEAVKADGVKILGANILEGRPSTTFWKDGKAMLAYIAEKMPVKKDETKIEVKNV